MIFVTTLSCLSMMFETPLYRVMDNPALQVKFYLNKMFIFLNTKLQIYFLEGG